MAPHLRKRPLQFGGTVLTRGKFGGDKKRVVFGPTLWDPLKVQGRPVLLDIFPRVGEKSSLKIATPGGTQKPPPFLERP